MVTTKKITQLASAATVSAASDVIPIVDVSDTSMASSGTSKKATPDAIVNASAHTGSTQVHGVTGSVVGTEGSQTLHNKTLVEPTIASMVNAQHTHANADGGGQLGTSALQGGAVTLAKLEEMAAARVMLRASGSGTGPPIHGTATQLETILAMTAALQRRAVSFGALRIVDIGLNTAPGSPTDGDAHVTGPAQASSTAWTGQENKVAVFRSSLSGWEFYAQSDGMAGRVTASATHHFKRAAIAYSADESLWYPLQPLWIITEHWTGEYYPGTANKMFSISISSTLTASSTTTSLTHGITRDASVPSAATCMVILSVPNVHGFIPQTFAGPTTLVVVFGTTTVTITHNSSADTGRHVVVRLIYAK